MGAFKIFRRLADLLDVDDYDLASNNTPISDALSAKADSDNVPATDPSGITGADKITNIVSLTQAEYDAIGTPDASTLYVIT